MNKMDLRVAVWSTRCWVDMETPEISAIIKSFVDGQIGEILVPESHNFTLGYKSSELVFTRGAELAELDAPDFGTNRWSQIIGCDAWRKKFWKPWVGIVSMVSMFEGLKCRVFLVTPCRKVVAVLEFWG
jgi:hypothetical protein